MTFDATLPAYNSMDAFAAPAYTAVATSSTLPRYTKPLDWLYRTAHMSINLGPRSTKTEAPAYGLKSLIKISIERTGKSSAYGIEVTLEGHVNTSLRGSRGAAVRLFSQSVQLVNDPRNPKSTVSCKLPIPSHYETERGPQPLPASFSAFHHNVECLVSYQVVVRLLRPGPFRKDECITIPILYFPKTAPCKSKLSKEFEERVYQRSSPIQLSSSSAAASNALSVSVSLPAERSFASGSHIPVTLKISSPTDPALAQLMSQNIQVSLVRRLHAWGKQKHISHEKTVACDVMDLRHVQNLPDAVIVSAVLPAGAWGEESSWGINGIIQVEHVLRFSVRPPSANFAKNLSSFVHEEPIHIATDKEAGHEPALALAVSMRESQQTFDSVYICPTMF